MPISASHGQGLRAAINLFFQIFWTVPLPNRRIKKTAAMILRTFRTQHCRLIMWAPLYASPGILPHYLSHMSKVDRISTQNVQNAFTINLPGPSPSLNHKAGCALFNHEPLWLRPVRINFALLFILCHSSAHSATNVKNDTRSPLYLLRFRYYTQNIPLRRVSNKAKLFTVAHCEPWKTF